MERAQARWCFSRSISHVRPKCWITEISQTRPSRGCATKKQPRPTVFQKARTPPTGTLWAPDMHSSRSALHACSFAWTGGWEARKVENGTHEKQIRQTTCCTCSIYIRCVLKAETLIDHSCGSPVGLIALLHLRIPTLKIQGSAKPWGQASAPPPTGVSHVTEKGTETERTQTPFSFSAKCNE